MLVNKEDGNVLPLGILDKRRLDGGNRGFCLLSASWPHPLELKHSLESTTRKFFFCCSFTCPIPARSSPVIESCQGSG